MGRLHRKNKRQKKQRTALSQLAGEEPTPVSDPETCGPLHVIREDHLSSETKGLCINETLETCPKTGGGGERAHTSGHRARTDEVEVMRKLSCLNFSVLPPSMASPSGCSGGGGDERLPSLLQELEVSSDLDMFSEMASGTQVELLPTLSDKDMEEMEGIEMCHRYSRKRPSKRKVNRRTKKFRYLNARDANCSKHLKNPPGPSSSLGGVASQQPLGVNFVRSSYKDTPGAPPINPTLMTGSPQTPPLSCTRSFRRSKRPQNYQDEELLRYLSDASILDTDTAHCTKLDVDEAEPMFETPPTSVNSERMVLPVDSELSETTSDSGCEGDDEESSVEGPVSISVTSHHPFQHHHHHHHHHPDLINMLKQRGGGGGRRKGGGGGGDPMLHQVLEGSFPLLSVEGREPLPQAPLSEFKHPGLCGKSGRKKKCKPRELTRPLNLLDINQRIVTFVRDASMGVDSEIKFSLVSRALCKTISSLAAIYHLECIIEQKRRLPVASPRLKKTPFTRIAPREEVEPILMSHGRECPGNALCVTKLHKPSYSSKSHSDTSLQLVGGGAESMVLDEGNIGNRILQGMGWSPGMGLGPERDGIRSPIKAYLRNKHTGLGFT